MTLTFDLSRSQIESLEVTVNAKTGISEEQVLSDGVCGEVEVGQRACFKEAAFPQFRRLEAAAKSMLSVTHAHQRAPPGREQHVDYTNTLRCQGCGGMNYSPAGKSSPPVFSCDT